MQRRVLFLRSKHDSAQRQRVVQLAGVMHAHRWACWSDDHPHMDRYDIIWIVDPIHIHAIHDTQYRLLVWDQTLPCTGVACKKAEALLADCANLTIAPGKDPAFYLRGIDPHSLDGTVMSELAEDVLDCLKEAG